MFRLLLLVYVMILDKIYFWKISTEDDIEKINYLGRQLCSAGAFRPDPKSIYIYPTSTFYIAALSEELRKIDLKITIRVTLVQEVLK